MNQNTANQIVTTRAINARKARAETRITFFTMVSAQAICSGYAVGNVTSSQTVSSFM